MARRKQVAMGGKADDLRLDLKRAGYKRTQVTVKSPPCGYSTSLHVTIRDPKVRISTIAKLANPYEHTRTCQVSGEPLLGGNTYLEIEYDERAIAPLVAQISARLDPIVADHRSSVAIGPHRVCSDREPSGGVYISTITRLARLGRSGHTGPVRYWGADGAARGLAVDLLDRGVTDLDDLDRRRFAINAESRFTSDLQHAERLDLNGVVHAADSLTPSGISSADVTRVCDLPIGQWIEILPDDGDRYTVYRIENAEVSS